MYDEQFFLDEERVARESAAVVMPWVWNHITPRIGYVIDVGCGTGEWGAALDNHDYECDVVSIDLQAPMRDRPLLRLDISSGIDCTGWDLAICLEVAEHLPAESAEPLVAGLARAGTVLWSAATPGQPGVGHINCQPPEYWAEMFARNGMTGEYIGAQFDGTAVASFYVRNLWLFRKAS